MSIEDHKDVIGSEKAKLEMQARREMARDEETKALNFERMEQERLAKGEPNFALYNFVMTATDFRKQEYKSISDFAHAMWRQVYPHFKRLMEDRKRMIDFIKKHEDNLMVPLDVREIMDRRNPEEMATDALNKVTELARQRTKLNKYGAKAREIKERTNG